jgi:hypothetical protein
MNTSHMRQMWLNTRQSSTITACTENIDPVSFILTGNQDNFYYHEILREPDKDPFLKAMQEEMANHNDNGNWEPVLQSTLKCWYKGNPIGVG